MKSLAKTLFAVSVLACAAQASAQVTFHEKENFQGRSFTSQQRLVNFERAGFNDRASSVVVVGQRWEACDDVNMRGRCVVLRPGQYPSLSAMGLDDRISSVRPLRNNEHVAEKDYAPLPIVAQDYRRRRDERLFDAPVTSVRAVGGTLAQRCWIEREQVAQQPQVEQQQAGLNIPGAAIGAIIGGILGHQVGGGSGQKIATVGGAVGGAALGAQYGRNSQPVQQAQVVPVTQDVRRCDNNAAQATPAYWDVTYNHEGTEHRVQMAQAPGQTITVNRRGEPRAASPSTR
ncbi:glycine zipper 2TM domain-containing protein [Ramlibacter sp. AW1]|uniref:Glycine zipper 2TM domain-containing protein n=1 Tax=Ramlibacter aurantiacus TaxID=2801330 RepID=A0A936ZCP3_9BURK|nr:beta/gamma crystallin-related protein [Ramlibacter aurantiacus]MBL0419184.1 glycine zipper 2TM domain-containing protein [Ramlibacter aurantiacus]